MSETRVFGRTQKGYYHRWDCLGFIINCIPNGYHVDQNGCFWARAGKQVTVSPWALSARVGTDNYEISYIDNHDGKLMVSVFTKVQLCDPAFCGSLPVAEDGEALAELNKALIICNRGILPYISKKVVE